MKDKRLPLAAREAVSSKLVQSIAANESVICEMASEININKRDLEVQALLYLPRLMEDDCFPDLDSFINEVRRLSSIIQDRISPYIEWRKLPAIALLSPHETKFVRVAQADARVIHENFHYLSSFRSAGLNFGLRTIEGNRLVALATLSPFDLEHIAPSIPTELNISNVMVVSRVFCFDWAPRNAISYMMGQLYKEIKLIKPEVKMLLTYINPNLGFSGSSLKASNWVLFGYERGTRYAYVDGKYVTDRQLIARFGTSESKILHILLKERFEVSKVRLDPLLLYAYFLDKNLSTLYPEGCDHEFWRP